MKAMKTGIVGRGKKSGGNANMFDSCDKLWAEIKEKGKMSSKNVETQTESIEKRIWRDGKSTEVESAVCIWTF